MHAALGQIEAHLMLPGGLESLHREGLDAHRREYTESPPRCVRRWIGFRVACSDSREIAAAIVDEEALQ